MPGDSLTLQGVPWELVLRMAVAALLGGLVGVEREYSGHSAGLRTNILVAVGACLFTVISIEGFPSTNVSDPARVAAQIVSGIGFLGAGAVFRDGNRVRGLTTAATIWLVAAMGMAVGAGLYDLAVAAVVMTLTVLVVLAPLSAALGRRRDEREARERQR
ncbi:MAG TPA: MgtC/SapB family protein [Chloroflexaceae bacterium]|nr:MgtC/SapB family protein [Chloroflexaceae bacterium]